MKAIFTLFLLVAAISYCDAQYLDPKTDQGIKLYNQGVDLFNAHHYAQAEAVLSKEEAIEPNSVHAHILRGICLYCISKDDASIAEMKKALSLDPGNKQAQAELKNAQHYATVDQEQATLNEAQTYLKAAQTDAVDNDDDGTLKNARACLSRDPHSGYAYLLEAAALSDLGKMREARADYRLAYQYGDTQVRGEAQKELTDEENLFEENVYKTFSLFLISLLWLWFRSPTLTRRALTYPTDRSVTPPLGGFNMGIGFFAPFWGIANRVYSALWGFLPGYGFFVHLYYGFMGQNRAWSGSRQQTARAFVQTQLAWAKASAWVWIVLHVGWLAALYHERDPSGPFSRPVVADLFYVDLALIAAMVITTYLYLKQVPPLPAVTAPAFSGPIPPFGQVSASGPVCHFCGAPAEPGIAACKHCGAPI